MKILTSLNAYLSVSRLNWTGDDITSKSYSNSNDLYKMFDHLAWDQLTYALRTNCWSPESPIAISGLEELDVRLSPPRTLSYDLFEDQKNYGSIFGGIGLMLSVLNGQSGYPDTSNESSMYHGRLEGRAIYRSEDDFRIHSEGTLLGELLPRFSISGGPTKLDEYGFPVGTTMGASARYSLVDALGRFSGVYPTTSDWDFTGIYPGISLWSAKTKIEAVKFTVDEEGVTFVITSRVRFTRSWRYHEVICESTFTLYGSGYSTFNPYQGIGATNSAFKSWRYSYTTSIVEHVESWDSTTIVVPSVRATSGTLQAIASCKIGKKDSGFDDAVLSLVKKGRALTRSHHLLTMPHLRGSCFLSATQAIEKFRSEIGSNYIELLSELDDVLSIIPDSKPIQDFLKLFPAGKFFAGTLRMADYAAKVYLIQNFVAAPLQDEIMNFSSTVDTIYGQITTMMKRDQLLYGKYVYDFEDANDQANSITGLEPYTLTTRSKVVVRFFDESPAITFMPFSASGLDPSVGNLWDLVPFSFVLDWFFQLGDRIRAFTEAGHMLIADTKHLVHTYSLEANASDVFGPFTAEDFDLSRVKYDFYQRDLSRFFPSVTEGLYDWFSKGEFPILMGGALLWALIRS